MTPLRSLIIINLAIIFSLSNLLAEPSTSSPDTIKYYFNPIIKTATKINGTQKDLAASISLIDNYKIQNNPANTILNLAQSFVPGLYVTEWGVMGFGVAGSAAGKLSVRGLGGTADTHVLILKNGRPDYMGLMGCTIADEFLNEGVEKIEIVRGPASFLYGTNATAGVINIISKRMTRDGFATKMSAGYGTFESQKFSLTHGGKLGQFDYYLTASKRKTDGHRNDANNNYDGNFYTGHLGYIFNEYTQIEFNASYADIFLYDPGAITAPRQDDWYDIQRWGGDLTLNQKNKFGDSYIKLHGNFGKHKFFDGWLSDDQMLGIMAFHNFNLFSGNTSTVGIDYRNYGGNGESLPSVLYQKKHLTEYAPYLHMQQLLLRHFILSAGLRLENNSVYGHSWLPKFGLVSHLAKTSSARLSISKGFRSPSLRELYFFPTHNENLQPENLWNYEIGLNQSIGPNIQFDLAVFNNHGENIIILTKRTTEPGFQLTNSGDFDNYGYELTLNWLPLENLELAATWAQLQMENQIPNAPGKKLTAYVSYSFHEITFAGNLINISDWIGRDNAVPIPNTFVMDDYTLFNLSISTKLYRSLGIKLDLDNLFDTQYQSMYGYPMPGRYSMLNLRYAF